jgi:hypothetical protein
VEELARLAFTTTIIEWRGPAPFLFAPVPEAFVGEVRFAAHEASYGWGVVPVTASIGATTFTTSLFPRNGGYLLPVKIAVQRAAAVGIGDVVAVSLVIRAR